MNTNHAVTRFVKECKWKQEFYCREYNPGDTCIDRWWPGAVVEGEDSG